MNNNLDEAIDSVVKVLHRILLLFIILIGVLSPGYILLFTFFRSVFKDYQTAKLIILAITISFPIFLINFVIAFKLLHSLMKLTGMESNYAFSLVFAGVSSTAVFYLPLILYFFGLQIHSLNNAIIAVIVLQGIILVLAGIYYLLNMCILKVWRTGS
jgi:hypothetical protein